MNTQFGKVFLVFDLIFFLYFSHPLKQDIMTDQESVLSSWVISVKLLFFRVLNIYNYSKTDNIL